MGDEAATPPGFWERVRMIAADEVAKLLRSGLLRNASISDGGLTIRGGFLRLLDKVLDVDLFYVGPVSPDKADGSPQQGWVVRRADGTTVLLLRDAFPTDAGGALQQALNWYDRAGNVVLADDTNGGAGLARPHLASAFYPARTQDMLKSTAAVFETVFRARVEKQQPKLYVEAWGWTDVAGTSGDVQVLVNGAALGTVRGVNNGAVTLLQFGPAVVAGNIGDVLNVEIQARRTAGTGNVVVGASMVSGWQT
jgi:hypothetical protein